MPGTWQVLSQRSAGERLVGSGDAGNTGRRPDRDRSALASGAGVQTGLQTGGLAPLLCPFLTTHPPPVHRVDPWLSEK